MLPVSLNSLTPRVCSRPARAAPAASTQYSTASASRPANRSRRSRVKAGAAAPSRLCGALSAPPVRSVPTPRVQPGNEREVRLPRQRRRADCAGIISARGVWDRRRRNTEQLIGSAWNERRRNNQSVGRAVSNNWCVERTALRQLLCGTNGVERLAAADLAARRDLSGTGTTISARPCRRKKHRV